MPGRDIPLVTNQCYHILNRGINLQPIFGSKREYNHMIDLMKYYRNAELPVRYSVFADLSVEIKNSILADLTRKNHFLVAIIAYCLMPNHFHFLLKQLQDGGISKFVANLTNSYTRYFNVKNARNGPLVQGKFRAVRVESDEQLLHLSRYIHLNPYSSYLVKTIEDLENYPYSSFKEYLGVVSVGFCDKEIILDQFKHIVDYHKFVLDQKDYQRNLETIKHLFLEEV